MPFHVLVGFSKHHCNTPPLRGSKRHSVNWVAPTHLPPYLMQAMASTRESMKTEPIWQGETSQVTWSSTGGTCSGLLGSPLSPIQMTQDLVLVGETIPCPNQVLLCVGPEDEYRIGQVRQNPGCRHDPGNQERLVHELSCPWKSTCPCQVSCVALQVGESDVSRAHRTWWSFGCQDSRASHGRRALMHVVYCGPEIRAGQGDVGLWSSNNDHASAAFTGHIQVHSSDAE